MRETQKTQTKPIAVDISKLSVRASEIDTNTGRIILPSAAVRAARHKNKSSSPGVVPRYSPPKPTSLHSVAAPVQSEAISAPHSSVSQAQPFASHPHPGTHETTAPNKNSFSVGDFFSRYRYPLALCTAFLMAVPVTALCTYIVLRNHELTQEVSTIRAQAFSSLQFESARQAELENYRLTTARLNTELTELKEEMGHFSQILSSLEFIVDGPVAEEAIAADLVEDVQTITEETTPPTLTDPELSVEQTIEPEQTQPATISEQ